MLVVAAVCPQPPLLVPDVAAGAAAELAPLRAGCDEAVGRLRDAEPDLLVVVGGGPVSRRYDATTRGSLAGYGLAGGPPPDDGLPLSLIIGQWLADRSEWTGERAVRAVAVDASPEACARIGVGLAALAQRVAMLVLGDGSACRSVKAPGYLDPRAEAFDAAIAGALGKADVGALRELDPGLSAELLVAGRPAWQVLVGAAGEGTFDGELLYDEAPYGVGYFVASWARVS